MTKKERIAELERRVAELEAQPAVYQPWWGLTPPSFGRCAGCGGQLHGDHQCPSFTTTAARRFIYEGALS
jgi:hypothetical protein